jgi:DNA-binding Lrp family transcriptional regulator
MADQSYLEDFLEEIEQLPNSVKRNFNLTRELDLEAKLLKEELTDLERRYIMQAKSKLRGNNAGADAQQLIEDTELMVRARPPSLLRFVLTV